MKIITTKETGIIPKNTKLKVSSFNKKKYQIIRPEKYEGILILKKKCKLDLSKYTSKVVKAAKDYKPWDHYFILNLLYEAIKQNRNYIYKHGIERKKERFNKVNIMDMVIIDLKNIVHDNFLNMAEKEIGSKIVHKVKFEESGKYYKLVDNASNEEQQVNKKIYEKALDLENETYERAFSTISENIRDWWD